MSIWKGRGTLSYGHPDFYGSVLDTEFDHLLDDAEITGETLNYKKDMNHAS